MKWIFDEFCDVNLAFYLPDLCIFAKKETKHRSLLSENPSS